MKASARSSKKDKASPGGGEPPRTVLAPQAPESQPLFSIQAVNPLRVHRFTLSAQQRRQTSIAEPLPLARQLA